MARKLRPDVDGAWHHVMNRGAARQRVFYTAADALAFLALLGKAVALHGIEVHAYCLMPNHYHLLLHCPAGGLSACMQRLAAEYTRVLNARLGRDGPIFRGRFHSLLVADAVYADRVGRYIHRNPTEIRPMPALDRYRWSSYATYIGQRPGPDWLRVATLLGMHEGVTGYREFVEGQFAVPPSVETTGWAIAVAMAERDEERPGPGAVTGRTVALALMADPASPLAPLAGRMLEHPSDAARNVALKRATARVAADAELRALLERVHHLAA